MLKDACVYLSIEHSDDAAVDYSISIASSFGIHLSAVSVAYEPIAIGSPFESAAAVVTAADRQNNERQAEAAAEQFEKRAKKEGISSESHVVRATLDDACTWFAELARQHDISILAQPKPDHVGPEPLLIEAALFESGRPVVIVPYIQRGGAKFDRIAVCWDGSAHAARAIHEAMPFLRRAKSVDIIQVLENGNEADSLSAAGMAEHLARHGLRVEIKSVGAADISIADAILSYVADNEIDFIVMGGYGHSRLREYVLGGTTHDILKTMTVPTLMSH